MAGIYFMYEDLYSLMKHEVALYERFDKEIGDHFSLIYFYAEGSDNSTIAVMFQKMLRNTDAIFHKGEHYFILLSKTDYNGAFQVLQGIHEFFGLEDLKECIVTFREDGDTALELITKIKELIIRWYELDLHLL